MILKFQIQSLSFEAKPPRNSKPRQKLLWQLLPNNIVQELTCIAWMSQHLEEN